MRVLLGPQRPVVNLAAGFDRAGLGEKSVAVISAAWQEAEGDIDDIRKWLPYSLSDLRLYGRAEELFATDKTLLQAYRSRQDQLIEQQRLYRLRLRQLTIAAREILRVKGNASAIAEERRHAISQLRALDRHHLRQVRKIHARYDESIDAQNNDHLGQHSAAIREELEQSDTVLITGGNVVVLINRLQLFGLGHMLRRKHIVGWSAGAMVLCDRVVLFHDRMPQGRREPEVMCEGLGLVPGTVLLPDAKGRLRTREPVRSSLFSRRFAPATCLTLDNESLLLMQDGQVLQSDRVRHISRDGKYQQVEVV